jgi:phosphoglycerate dehydrogenase-like enzyme
VTTAVHIGPAPTPALLDAVAAAGASPTSLPQADAVVWLDPRPETMPELPDSVRWVQLPGAGVDRWLARIRASPGATFTSAGGVYARPVAEHALALLLAGVRRLAEASRATTWTRRYGGTLDGAAVAVIGAGGIGSALIGLLGALGAKPIAVTRSGRPVAGAARCLSAEHLPEVWPAADHVVLTAPSTPDTQRLVGRTALATMREHAWLVNIARGTLVDTDALADALDAQVIAGAALDVTDPEPLPDGHRLWSHPRALITAHVATPPAPASPYFAARVRENVARFIAAEPLLSQVDPEAGY